MTYHEKHKEICMDIRKSLNLGIEDIFLIHMRSILSQSFDPIPEVSLVCAETDSAEFCRTLKAIPSPHTLRRKLKGIDDQLYLIEVIAPSIPHAHSLEKGNIFNKVEISLGTYVEDQSIHALLINPEPEILLVYQISMNGFKEREPKTLIISLQRLAR